MVAAQHRLTEIREALDRWADALPADDQVAAALKEFDGLNGNVDISFESTSIKTLGEALPHLHDETAA
jgi:hypothetical protein